MRLPTRRRQILTVAQRQTYLNKLGIGPLGIDPADVGGGEAWYQAPHSQPLIPSEVAAKKARIRAILEEGSPQNNGKAYKAKRDRRIKELEEELRKEAIPMGYYHMKRQDSTDYHKVVTELAKQMTDPRRRAMEDELKNLRRERDFDNPIAGKLTDLREDQTRRITV